MNDQGTNVIDLTERIDNGERIPVSELCRARDSDVLPINTAPVTRIPSPAEAEQAHLEKTLERHGLTGLGEVAGKRERLLDDALLEQQHLLGRHGAEALTLGRNTAASKLVAAMRYVEEARREMGVRDV